MLDLARANAFSRHGGGGAIRASSRYRLLATSVSLATLALLTDIRSARADNECGAGTAVVCAPAGNPYGSGITYNSDGGIDLSFAPGVAVDASGASGIRINNSNSGDVVVNTTNGSVRSADQYGIYVNNSVGGANITTGDVSSDNTHAIYASASGPIVVDTTAGTVMGVWGAIYASTNDAAIAITTADVTTNQGTGIFATSYGASSTIDINTTAGTVSAQGDFGGGINAVSYVNSGPIRIVTGDVSTTGMYSNAVTGAQMSAGSAAPLSIDTTAGVISTKGDYSIGIGAYAATRAEVRTGPITTVGVESAGVYAHGVQASLTIDTTAGAIQTQGASSAGILASNDAGDISVTAGPITTSGAAAIGIALTSQNEGGQGGYRNDVVVTGPITATGANSGGVVARDVGAGGPMNVTARANITATGQNSVGIAAGSFNGPVTVTVDSGVTVMGGWSQNPDDLSTGASRSSTGIDESTVSTYVGGGLPAAGVVLFSGSTGQSSAAHLINNGSIGALNDRAVTMGFPCAERSGGGSGGILLLEQRPASPLQKLASAVMDALIPSAHAAVPPANRGCSEGDPGNPDWGIPPTPADPANTLPPTGSVTIDNHETITGYVTLWDGAAHTFNNAGTFDVRHFADTDGDGIRDTKAVSISDFGGPDSTFNNPGLVRFAPVANAARTDAAGYYVPTTGVDNRTLEAGFYDLNREGVVQGQFVNLQTFNHSGIIDLRGAAVGNTLVMTSNATVGGAPGTGTFVANGGQLLVNTVINEGIAPGGASGSYSDMLIVDRTQLGTAPTAIGISYDASVAGALTTGNGIEIVEVRDKANSAAGVFVQGNRVAGSAYEYRLYHNGVGGDAADGNWYLRSTRIAEVADPAPGPDSIPASIELPDYRVEVPTDMVVPSMASRLGLAMLGTYDDRLGAFYLDPPAPPAPAQEIWCKDASRNFRCTPSAQQNAYYAGAPVLDPYRWRMWGRVFGEYGDYKAGGSGDVGRLRNFTSRGPSYDVRLGGIQLGVDLYRDPLNTAGLYVGYGRALSDVDAIYGGPAGKVSMDGYSLGAYWTHRRPNGWYVDAVAQGTYYGSIEARSVMGERLKTDGWGFAASLEAGYPIALGASWTLTPQVQAIYQHLAIDGGADSFGRVSYDEANSVFGRIGAKLNKDWIMADGRMVSTWARVNYWHGFGAEAKSTFTNLSGANPVTLGTSLGSDWVQFGLGASGQLTRNVAVFASADYNLAVAHGTGHSVGGRVGLQVRW